MRIITLAGDVVAEGKRMQHVRMHYGVQNLDGTHMEPGRIYQVPDYFRQQLVGMHRASDATAEEFAAQEAASENSGSAIVTGDPAPVHGDPSPVNGDPSPKPKKK